MPAPIASLITRRLGCTPAEALALCILALASLACVGLLWLQARPSLAPAPGPVGSAPSEAASGGIVVTDAEVIVHVAGAVARPGVYTLAGGSRIGDAVTAAGGPLRKAVLDGLNLAKPLTDGEQVLVPDRSQVATAPAAGGAPGAPANPAAGSVAAGGSSTVSLNSATLADLETLPGIGPVLAQRILDHRDAVGGFKQVGELRDVSGIGEKTFQSLAPLVSP